MAHPEETIVYGLLIVIGALPVALALAQPGGFGGEATFGLLMMCAGGVGLVVRSWRTRHF